MSLDPQITAFLDQEDAHLAAVLREHRWAVQWVGPGAESGQPPFAYTIGLFGLGHPELVVSGVGPAVARGMLNWAAALVVAGRDLVPGEELSRETGGRLVVEVLPQPRRDRVRREPLVSPAGRVLGARPPADLARRRRPLPVGRRLRRAPRRSGPAGDVECLTTAHAGSTTYWPIIPWSSCHRTWQWYMNGVRSSAGWAKCTSSSSGVRGGT